MIGLIKRLHGRPISDFLGIQFAPENTIVAVYRYKQFLRFESGYFVVNPISDSVGDPIKLGIRSGEFAIKQIQTKDSYFLSFDTRVKIRHDPRKSSPEHYAIFARIPEERHLALVGDEIEHILRRCVAEYSAQTLANAEIQCLIETRVELALNRILAPMGSMVRKNSFMLGQPTPSRDFIHQINNYRQVNHLVSILAEDGELCFEDKLVIANSIGANLPQKTGAHSGVLDLMVAQQLINPRSNQTNKTPLRVSGD